MFEIILIPNKYVHVLVVYDFYDGLFNGKNTDWELYDLLCSYV